jgi:hypothetical protein
MAQWSDFLPDLPYAGAYGTGTPQEEATRAPTPLYNATRGAINAAMVPGQVMQSQRKYGWAGLGALPAMQGREEKTEP